MSAAALTAPERADLADQEASIESGAEQVARALTEIRDRRLYRDGYSTFEDYCRERWGMTHRHVNRKIIAAEVADALESAGAGPIGPIPEGQARELSDLRDDPESLRGIYDRASASTGGRVTAAALRAARYDPRADVAEFPVLAYYVETGRSADVEHMAGDLRTFRARGELDERLDNLRRSIAVDKAKRDGTYKPTPAVNTETGEVSDDYLSDDATGEEVTSSTEVTDAGASSLADDVEEAPGGAVESHSPATPARPVAAPVNHCPTCTCTQGEN